MARPVAASWMWGCAAARPASNITRGVSVRGQAAARRRPRIRFLAVGVVLFTGLLVAVPAVQPAGASPVRAASGAQADRAGSLAKKSTGSPVDDIQSALLK